MASKKIFRERGPVKQMIDNFLSSFFVKSRRNVVGVDHLGNTYYELISDYSNRHRSLEQRRGFVPQGPSDMGAEGVCDLPSEWEAWLRGRRIDPPTQEEINANMAVAAQKREGSALIAEKSANAADTDSERSDIKMPSVSNQNASLKKQTLTSYPVYEEYETAAGIKTKP